MTNEEKEAFYEECGKILGVEHDFVTPHYRLTRWNNRAPGNGRFEGRGLVRAFGDNNIQILIHTPERVEKTVGSIQEAFDTLRSIMGTGNI